jgi:hypothetical protein
MLQLIQSTLPVAMQDLSSLFQQASSSYSYPSTTSSDYYTTSSQESAHPCGSEIMQCMQLGASTRAEIKQCLITNQGYVSSNCKCFLHQIAPNEVQTRAATAPEPTVEAVDTTDADEEYDHGLCMLIMPLFLFAFILLVRRCCLLCRKQPTFEAVVLPEVTTIKTVEPLVATVKVQA